MRDALSAIRTAKELNHFIQLHRWMFAAIVEPALRGFPEAELLVSETGASGWNTARLADLARRLDLDVPLFVAKVAAVTVRQTTSCRPGA